MESTRLRDKDNWEPILAIFKPGLCYEETENLRYWKTTNFTYQDWYYEFIYQNFMWVVWKKIYENYSMLYGPSGALVYCNLWI
jgi:hypothetical protein